MKKFLSCTLVVALLLTLLLSCFACGDKTEPPFNAKYTLQSATANGKSVKKDFQTYSIELFEDGTAKVFISYLGLMESRSSTYVNKGTSIVESYMGKDYTYRAEGDTLTTTYIDYDKTVTVVLKKETAGDKVEEVDFESVLFGEDMTQTKFFNYCPAIITETDENGNEVMHIWFCTNKDDGLIMDHIGYRKGVKQANGKWIFSELQIVMQPTPDTWDARHTCDPAVIKGEFQYQGEKYCYLMAYLGCVTEDYSNNETGIAVANSPVGPWVKVDTLNPIVPWADECQPGQWGTGMPALISIDKKGEVLLTYQSSKRGTGVQRWDFSNLDDPTLKAQFNVSLTHKGIYNSANIKCNVGIPDFAFDPETNRLYVFGVTNEKNPPDETKTLVNSHCVLAYIENIGSMEEACTVLQSGNYTWNVVGYVGPADTGFERNHNPGIVRDCYGYIPESEKIGVVVATGHNSWDNENIFTYRLHGHYFDINL
ncbi:MAG: hypothetical protein IJF71_05100 [Clostridia bacterium]|nr:hypothetical protein [Clostridia bacterium]